jgi:hypothetical protein
MTPRQRETKTNEDCAAQRKFNPQERRGDEEI